MANQQSSSEEPHIKFLEELKYQLSEHRKNEDKGNSLCSSDSIVLNLSKEFPNYEECINELIRRSENYDKRKLKSDKMIKEFVILNRQIMEKTDKIEDQNKKISSLTNQNNDIEKSLNEKNKEFENLKNQNEHLKKELETANEKWKKLNKKKEKISEDYEKKFQELTKGSVIQNTGPGTINVNQGDSNKESVIKKLKEKNETLITDNGTLNQKLCDHETQCNKLQEKNGNLEKENSDLKLEIERLKSEINSLKSKIISLNSEIERLQSENDVQTLHEESHI